MATAQHALSRTNNTPHAHSIAHIVVHYTMYRTIVVHSLIESAILIRTRTTSGYTESHYDGLVKLYDRFKASAVDFNILAFPCNQFGEQE